jgi:hypothetical protein
MVDNSREITSQTFFKHVDRKEVEDLLGYDRHLRISQDYYVQYFKSKYAGKPCYYVVHSAIEYIFIKRS